jgi:predicted ribosomally synthesized peptide with SipW-like signal peptide
MSLAMVGVIAAGATLAYLTAKTPTKTNVFTAGTALTGALKEDAYDGADYDQAVNPVQLAADALLPSPTLGINQAKNITPGRVINKDPQVKNTSAAATGSTAWVAIKLEATYPNAATSSAALNAIEQIATIDWNTTKWEKVVDANGNVYFFYQDVVDPQAETQTLFNTVTIKNTADVSDLKDFNISVTAALVQRNGNDGLTNLNAATKTALMNLLTPPTP